MSGCMKAGWLDHGVGPHQPTLPPPVPRGTGGTGSRGGGACPQSPSHTPQMRLPGCRGLRALEVLFSEACFRKPSQPNTGPSWVFLAMGVLKAPAVVIS